MHSWKHWFHSWIILVSHTKYVFSGKLPNSISHRLNVGSRRGYFVQLLRMKWDQHLNSVSNIPVKNLPAVQETRVWSLDWEDSPGEGNGNPLQYSGLENSMDRGSQVRRLTQLPPPLYSKQSKDVSHYSQLPITGQTGKLEWVVCAWLNYLAKYWIVLNSLNSLNSIE